MTTLGTPLNDGTPKKQIVIAEGYAALRGLLRQAINREPGCEIVGEAAKGTDALRLCRQLVPDVLVLELALPEMSGAELIGQMRKEGLPTRTLVFTGSKSEDLLMATLRAQPHGFVHKENSLPVFLLALRAVLQGGSMRCPISEDLSKRLRDNDPGVVLGARQRTVLTMLAEGIPNKVIAGHLGVSEKTVEHERARLMNTLGLRDVASLTRAAMRMGLVN